MGYFFAAYDLGFSVLMLRYNLRYHARYPFDPMAVGGAALVECHTAIVDALAVLQSVMPNDDEAQQIRHRLGRLMKDLVGGALNESHDEFNLPAALRDGYRNLAIQSHQLMRPCLRLLPWYQLGRAMALCCNNLLYHESSKVLEQRVDALPHFVDLISAAKNLPTAPVAHLPTINRLRNQQHSKDRSAAETLASFVATLNEPVVHHEMKRFKWRTDTLPLTVEKYNVSSTELDGVDPLNAIRHKVPKLEQAIRHELYNHREAPVRLEVFLTREQPYVVRDSQPTPINYIEARVLQVVIDNAPHLVASEKMLSIHSSLDPAGAASAASRAVTRLNSVLGTPIFKKKCPGGGYRLAPEYCQP